MWLRGKTAVFAALGVLALVPAAGFGQAGPAAPPAGETGHGGAKVCHGSGVMVALRAE
jgi:hypothetical protein